MFDTPDDRSLRQGRWREAFVCANAALVFSAPFLARLTNWGIHDWELFSAMGEIPRTLLLQFGQFPYWNPYIGGGNILFHHPEVAVLTPLYLLPLLFGSIVGLKLQVTLCYFLGFWGSVRFARALGRSELSAYLFAAIYFGSSYFALHFAEGHIPFTHFCFLSWVGYFWLRALRRPRYIVHAAAALALMILGNGAAAPLLLSATFLAALAALRSLQTRRIRPLAALATIGVAGVGLAAIKFLPMTAYLLNNPWGGEPGDVTPFSALPAVFFSFDQSLLGHRDLGLAGGWHEYGAYLSPLAVVLALWAGLRTFRRHWPWLALALAFLALGLGGFADWAPWKLLSHLPGFSSSRAPGRMFQFVLLSLGALAAVGFDEAMKAFDTRAALKRSKAGLVATILALIAGGNVLIAHQSLTQSFTRQAEQVQWRDEFVMQVGDPLTVYRSVRENRGSILTPWLSAYHEGRGLVTPGGETLPDYTLAGDVTMLSRQYRGNEIHYRVQSDTGGELALSMGFDPGWQVVAPDGWTLREEQGVLAVTVSPGTHELYLRYRTPHFWSGAATSLLFAFGLAIFWRRAKFTG